MAEIKIVETSPESGTTTQTTATIDPIRPGWRTTEFWLKIAAIILTALFASGAIPTTGTAAMVAAIAATILGALGYTVGRSLVKAAGAALILCALFASSQTACGPVAAGAGRAKVAVIDCTKADAGQIAAVLAGFAPLLRGSAPDWKAVEANAIAAGTTIGGCALQELWEGYASPKLALTGMSDGRDAAAQAVLEHFRANHAGGAIFSTGAR
jgi:hypothetical protein